MGLTMNKLAAAIASANPNAGRVDEACTVAMRIACLKSTYLKKGDPYGWGGGGAKFTILCEEMGGGVGSSPMSYYENDQSFEISAKLPGYFVEWANGGVALVYPA